MTSRRKSRENLVTFLKSVASCPLLVVLGTAFLAVALPLDLILFSYDIFANVFNKYLSLFLRFSVWPIYLFYPLNHFMQKLLFYCVIVISDLLLYDTLVITILNVDQGTNLKQIKMYRKDTNCNLS